MPTSRGAGWSFILQRCNQAGFITILVHNKVDNVTSGYTLVGTGEVLWTLGEHYQRTRDKAWLRKVAPDVARICRWIMRQREKTKRPDARGEKVPEYGLMPPGVTADWNRFAYRFFNDAQYYRGLEIAGGRWPTSAIAAAPAILADAEAYRKDIAPGVPPRCRPKRRSSACTTALGCPPIRRLLGCFGDVEDFMPGEDRQLRTIATAWRSAPTISLATGMLDAASPDADWMIDYLEDVQFLRASRSGCRWQGSPVRPGRLCEDAALLLPHRRDPRPARRREAVHPLVFQHDSGAGELRGPHVLGRHLEGNVGSGAWNKTHETGWFLCQTRLMFVMERGDELWLAPFVTNNWLKDGMKVSVRNAPTRFGKVSYTIASNVAAGDDRGRRRVAREMHGQADRAPPAASRGQADPIGDRAGQAAHGFRPEEGDDHAGTVRREPHDPCEVLKPRAFPAKMARGWHKAITYYGGTEDTE